MRFVKYLLFILTAVFVLANSDFRKLVKNYFSLHKAQKQSINLDIEYDKMLQEKELLTDDAYLEEVARLQMHMTKPNEYEFRFTPPIQED